LPDSPHQHSGSGSIEFVAAISRVTTLADGGIRVVFDLSEDAIEQAMWLMQLKRDEAAVKVTCAPFLDGKEIR